MKAVTIFGREPVAWVGLIESALLVLLAFGIGIGQETFGPIMGFVSAGFGAYTAWATKDTELGWVVGFFKAGLVLAAVYGLSLSDQQTAALVAVVGMVASFWQRGQTSPVAYPVDPSPQQVTASPIPSSVQYAGDAKVDAALHSSETPIYDELRDNV